MASRHSAARGYGACLVLTGFVAIVWSAFSSAGAADDFPVTIDTTASGTFSGRLDGIGADGVRATVDGVARSFPLDGVRQVVHAGAAAAVAAPVAVTCVDGSRLSGMDVGWEDGTLTLTHPAGPITIPAARVLSIAWGVGTDVPDWLAALPADEASDLLVVRKGNGFEFVACAITAIARETVTVVLDDETIPVKRSKVLGMRWLREAAPRGSVAVRVDGGEVSAGTVAWSPAGLVLDNVIRMPAALLRSIDYAGGRTVRLATLATERLDVEPFFGALGRVEGLAEFFRPRAAPAAGGPGADLILRPRTTAVWRIPADSRIFRTTIRAAGTASAAGPIVTIAIDGREVFRGAIDEATIGEGIAVGPVPLEAARRLSVAVDFGSAGVSAGAVVLRDPVFVR